jgi:TonB family protein
MSFALDIVAKTAVILMSAAVLSLLLARGSASLRHAIWILALVSASLLPVATPFVPQLEWSALPEASTSVIFLAPPNSAAASTVHAESNHTPRAAPAQVSFLWPVFIWLLGVAVLLTRLITGAIKVRKMAENAIPAVGTWKEECANLSGAFGIRRSVRLLFSSTRVSPLTWGVWRHTILLPSHAAQWSVERRRLVLAHELAHVKRRDALMQIIVQMICGLYWFNPLVWYATHRVRIERERACDDHVLRLGAVAADYADHLVQIARSLRDRSAFSLPAVSMAHPSQLETRLVSILDARVRRRTLSRIGATALCLIAALITVSFAAIEFKAAVPLPSVSVVTAKVMVTTTETKHAAPPAAPPSPLQRTHIGNADNVPNNAVNPPRVLESKKPIYTDDGIRRGIEGTVILEAAVDLEGHVKVLRVLKGLGYGLDERAIGSVLDWKFAPATKDGVPVEAITQIDVDFKLPPPRFDPKDGAQILIFGQFPNMKPPLIISRVEPQYSEEAKAAHYQGTVTVQAIVHNDGTLTVEKVLRELGMGLDESAVSALEQWKFKPATREGEPVPVQLNVEVNFNLK